MRTFYPLRDSIKQPFTAPVIKQLETRQQTSLCAAKQSRLNVTYEKKRKLEQSHPAQCEQNGLRRLYFRLFQMEILRLHKERRLVLNQPEYVPDHLFLNI
jgi:hypothetical protein